MRGLIRFRRLVFIGPGVRIRGASRLSIGKGTTLERGVRLDCFGKHPLVLGQRAKLGAMSIVSVTSHLSRLGVGCQIGDDSSLGEYCYLGASGGIRIGNDVIMGQFISFHSQEHLFGDPEALIRSQGTTEKGIDIGDDCWIGARVTFLDGSIVGAHSVVAAGAVVRGEFPAHSVIAGIPARIVSSRKSDRDN